MNTSYLLDTDFLTELDQIQHREVYARITSLDYNENAIEYIEGRVTSGSINIDGSSAVRRTCSLSLLCQDVDINEFYWGIKTKFKLEIGLKNTVPAKKLYNYTYQTDMNGNILYFITLDGIDYQSVYVKENDEWKIGYYISLYDSVTIKQLTKAQEQKVAPKILEAIPYYEPNPYPEIIWFPQGIFVITTFNTSIGTNSCSISISGKDKMCLLNGDLSGSLTASIDFGTEEIFDYNYTPHKFSNKTEYVSHKYYLQDAEGNYYLDEGNYLDADGHKQFGYNENAQYFNKIPYTEVHQIPLEKIIKEAIHTWANEPYHNIIINDLDTFGLEQLQYKGNNTLYALRKIKDEVYTQIILNDDTICYPITSDEDKQAYLNKTLNFSTLSKQKIENFKDETAGWISIRPTEGLAAIDEDNLTWIVFSTEPPEGQTEIPAYTALLLEYGDDAGYRITDLVYTGDLVSSIGESLTSILDKIVAMLGDFEYFYNLDGQFIFQRKRTFANVPWSSTQKIESETITYPAELASATTYNFADNTLVTAFSNTPALSAVRNDFSVWGTRTSLTGIEIPVHARYAIDTKPFWYKTYEENIYATQEGVNKYNNMIKQINPEAENISPTYIVDWREIIYQMALDFFTHNQEDTFLAIVAKNNYLLYPTGYTGYEQYYTDLEGFWRQLYNPEAEVALTWKAGQYVLDKENIDSNIDTYERSWTWQNPVLITADCDYYLPTNMIDGKPDSEVTPYYDIVSAADPDIFSHYLTLWVDEMDERKYWNKAVFEAPETLNFWFDFLDDTSELAQFSVKTIGDRTKVSNDSKVKSIYYKQIPDFIFTNAKTITPEQKEDKSAYTFLYLPSGMENLFAISYRGKSAKDAIDDLVYQYGYCAENILITAIPIYYLEPNTRIFVEDKKTNISGEYIISRISLSLAHNGTMSITASKAPTRLY